MNGESGIDVFIRVRMIKETETHPARSANCQFALLT